ncbi:MAG: hypothetical protein J7L34_03540 [Thermotogaceae bacterium]|nr:hypothetical protein [Thermotogaceae bacterium]
MLPWKNLEFEYCVFGLAGVGEYCTDSGKVVEVIKEALNCRKAAVCGDSVMAYVGAFGGFERGVLVHSGTGSLILVYDGEKFIKYGGWGHLLGDDGSGYRIAVDGIREVLKYWEGWGEETLLEKAVKETFNAASRSDVIKLVYLKSMKKREIAALAKEICEIADKDKVARKVLQENAKNLLKPLKYAMKAVGSNIVSYSGGLFSCQVYREIVKELVEDAGGIFQGPSTNPLGGAVFVAKEKFGVNFDVEEVLKRIEEVIG